MGGKSLRAERGHKEVFDLYEQKIKEFGKLSSRVTRGTYWEEIERETDYCQQTIRKIVAKFLKRHSADYKGNCKPLKI